MNFKYNPSYEGIITHVDRYEGTDYASLERF